MVAYRFHHHPKKMHKLSKDCFKGKSGSPNASLLLGLFPGVGPRCARARGREALPPAGEVLGARRLARGWIGDRNWGFSPMVFPQLEVQPPESAKTRVWRNISNQWFPVECRGSSKDFVGLVRLVRWKCFPGWLLLNSYYCLLRQQFFTVFGLYDHPIKATITEVCPQEDQEDAIVLLLSPLRIINNYTHTPMTHKKYMKKINQYLHRYLFSNISANILVYPFILREESSPSVVPIVSACFRHARWLAIWNNRRSPLWFGRRTTARWESTDGKIPWKIQLLWGWWAQFNYHLSGGEKKTIWGYVINNWPPDSWWWLLFYGIW